MTAMSSVILGPVLRWLGKLSYPRLFVVIFVLFVGDVLLPDFIPFVDELLLGLGALFVASWKKRKEVPGPTTGNLSPPPDPR